MSYLYMVLEQGSSFFGFPVHTQVGHGVKGVLECVRVHWLRKEPLVYLHGLGQSFPRELNFEVELGSNAVYLQ